MRLIAQCCAAVMTAALITLPAAAAQAEPAANPDSATLPEALERDLAITPAEATARQQKEQAGVPVAEELRSELDGKFGGSWFDKGKLKVGVTDDAAAKAVRDKGAEPVPVARSEKALDDTKSALDSARSGTEAVHSWYVDPTSNTVVVTAASEQAGREFAAKAGVEGSVRVTTGHEMKPAHDLRGGDQYVINGNTLCSVGFPVNGGFVTAGHCGGTGSTTKGFNNVNQGTFAGSSFPGQDYAWVRTNGDWASKPWVNNYSGGNVVVAGSQEAGVGATICRSGRTTGWRCGTIQAKNVTVNYGGRIVNGLVSTTACAEGGDSGGAVLSGNQAQGVTSGAGGNCSNGGTSVYQPLKPILSAYGLTLTTNGSGGSGTKIIGHQNRCIDVPNSNAKDGQRLQVWDCNGTNAQNWTFAGDGTVRAFGMCMDVAWGSRDNGAAIQLATCSGNPAQQFVLSGAGDLVNPQANKCVDITGSWGSGSALQQWECTGKSNQKWRKG